MWQASKYKSQYDKVTKIQKKRINVQNMPENVSLGLYLDEDQDDLPPLEGDKEETITERAKSNPLKRKIAGTGLKILTPNKLLTRLPILLAQIKARNN